MAEWDKSRWYLMSGLLDELLEADVVTRATRAREAAGFRHSEAAGSRKQHGAAERVDPEGGAVRAL
jgi:hypothetical protein